MSPPRSLLLVMIAAFAACSTTTETTRQDAAGRFVMTTGGFNEWLVLELNPDGSYGLDHAMFACVIGPNGEMPMHYGREEGAWRIDRGIVALTPSARSKDFMDEPVFIVVHTQRLAFRQAAGRRTLVHATTPDSLVLTESADFSFPFFRRDEVARTSASEPKADASR